MLREQQRRWFFGDLDHRYPGVKGLDREDEGAVDPLGELGQLTGHVAAWQVDEVKALKQQPQRTVRAGVGNRPR